MYFGMRQALFCLALCGAFALVFIASNRVARPGRAWAVSTGLSQGTAPAAKSERQTITGKVTPLNSILQKMDVRLDPDAAATWYALVTDEGKVFPLVKDDGSRMFFSDARLLNRTMRITGRILPKTQLLQVLEVQSVVNGKLHEVYYWCDICTIKRFEKKICECCGEPMELRETPVKD